MIKFRAATVEDFALVNSFLSKDDLLNPESAFDIMSHDHSYVILYTEKEYQKLIKKNTVLIAFEGEKELAVFKLTNSNGRYRVLSCMTNTNSFDENKLVLKELLSYEAFASSDLCIETEDLEIQNYLLSLGFTRKRGNFFHSTYFVFCR